MSSNQLDPLTDFESGPMRPLQIVAVTLCVVLNMLDGFDVLVMSFSASEIAKAWSLTGAQLGVLLSAGLVGMAAGSLFVAPIADRWGRRLTIVLSLILLTVGMALSCVSRGPQELALLRVVTGLGIGTMLASISVIASEYASLRWRNAAVSLQATGYPIGATLGGIIAAWLMTHYGWRSLFAFGAAASAVLIPVVLWGIPESLQFLLTRQPANALAKLNQLLDRLGRQPLQSLPARSPDSAEGRARFVDIVTPPMSGSTLRIWVGFFMVMLTFYFVLSWTPKLLVAAGLSARQGITGGVLLNIGGIVGGSLLAWLSLRGSLKVWAALSMIAASSSLIAYGYLSHELSWAFGIAFLSGICVFGSMVALYALTPRLYPPGLRTTGTGWAIGVGRLGAILAPLVAGVLVDKGWTAPQLYFLFAAPMLIAMVSVSTLAPPVLLKPAAS